MVDSTNGPKKNGVCLFKFYSIPTFMTVIFRLWKQINYTLFVFESSIRANGTC